MGRNPKKNLVFQPSIFRCYVSFRESKLVLSVSSSVSSIPLDGEGKSLNWEVPAVVPELAKAAGSTPSFMYLL